MDERMAASGSVASVVSAEENTVALFPTGGFYRPGRSYDEMFAADGTVRPHYAALQARMTTLAPAELADRQRTLEQSFLLQGITFTVYGA
jgi:hypothetical protein